MASATAFSAFEAGGAHGDGAYGYSRACGSRAFSGGDGASRSEDPSGGGGATAATSRYSEHRGATGFPSSTYSYTTGAGPTRGYS